MLSLSSGCSNNLLLIWTDCLGSYCELGMGQINIGQHYENLVMLL